MAGVGHLAVGLTAARFATPERRSARATNAAMLFWSALSFLPDADVIGFQFGVIYTDPWGHRGATHSLVFAVALGALVGLGASVIRRPALRTGVLATLVVASHGLLDTLTNGGFGSALFWPFDLTRYFAPWTPIPVSPLGRHIFSAYGVHVMTVELLIFAPLFLLALWPRRRRA